MNEQYKKYHTNVSAGNKNFFFQTSKTFLQKICMMIFIMIFNFIQDNYSDSIKL